MFTQTGCDELLKIYKNSYDDIYHTVCFSDSLHLCKIISNVLRYVVTIHCVDFFCMCSTCIFDMKN